MIKHRQTKIAQTLLLFVALSTFTLSCNEQGRYKDDPLSDTEHKIYEVKHGKIDTVVKTVLEAHPTFKTNSIALKEAERDLILSLAENASPQLLEPNFYNVNRIFKNPTGKGYIVHLYTTQHQTNYQQLDSSYAGVDIAYDVLGKISDSLATTVNEKDTLLIKCSNVKRLLTEKQIADYVNQTYHYQLVRIGTEERAKVELGVFLCDIEALSPAFNKPPLAY